jgi:hypothetical protein
MTEPDSALQSGWSYTIVAHFSHHSMECQCAALLRWVTAQRRASQHEVASTTGIEAAQEKPSDLQGFMRPQTAAANSPKILHTALILIFPAGLFCQSVYSHV